jgi:hypothetical protein
MIVGGRGYIERNKQRMTETCYMCNAPATSREHVPPRCLFPEEKDMPGTSYRDNLITVPSCDDHNLAKSKDDGYLMYVFPVFILNDPIAKQHVDTKVLRALKRKPKVAAALVREGCVIAGGMAYMRVETERILKCCDHMIRGLYFHEFGRRWIFSLELFSCAFIPSSSDRLDEFEQCREMGKGINRSFEDEGIKYSGANPTIFKFRFLAGSENIFFVQLVFYGALVVSGVGKREEV